MTEFEAAADCASAREAYEMGPTQETADLWLVAARAWFETLDADYTRGEIRRATEATEEGF